MSSSPQTVHLSPSGKWEAPDFKAHAWVSGDNRAKTWTYWWMQIDAGQVDRAEYEVLRDGNVVMQRTQLVASPKLFAKTGYVDEEPDPPGYGPIGGAAKLDAGIYDLDFYFTIGGYMHVLRGVRFEVADRKAKNGGWQILPNDEKKG
jgi:hypothetical protein